MNAALRLVLRELRHEKGRTVLLCMTVALVQAGLYVILSLSVGYWRYFLEQAALIGKDPAKLAWQGVLDVGVMLLEMLSLLSKGGLTVILKAGDIFSGEAALKNLPAFILLSGLTVLIAVRCAFGLLFSVYRRQHRHFLTSLLVGGADADFVERYIRTEALCLWGVAFPVGVLLGITETAVLRYTAVVFFNRSVGMPPPVAIRDSLLFALIAGLAALWMTRREVRKSGRNLSVKNAAKELRRQTGALLGIRALTGEASHYRILGLQHYIAMRNIEDRLGRYMRIFLMTTVYLSVAGCFLLLMTFVRNSAVKGFAPIPGGEAFFSANEFFFCASAAVTQVIATVGTVCGMISNITSNAAEYAQLRAAGASMRMIRRCARREGVLCVFIGIWIGFFWMLSLFSLFVTAYNARLPGGIDFSGAGKTLFILGAFTLIHMIAVFAAVLISCRKVDRIDLLQELKELAYS